MSWLMVKCTPNRKRADVLWSGAQRESHGMRNRSFPRIQSCCSNRNKEEAELLSYTPPPLLSSTATNIYCNSYEYTVIGKIESVIDRGEIVH